MTALFASLLSIAAMILLDKATTWGEAISNQKSGISADQVIALITKMTNEARAKGSNVMNQLNDKLSAVQLPYGVSSNVKEKIMDARRQLSQKVRQTRERISEGEAQLAQVENRASNLAAQPESVRAAIGSQSLHDIKSDAAKATKIFDDLKGVETNA